MDSSLVAETTAMSNRETPKSEEQNDLADSRCYERRAIEGE
jgi:hypothetical protein